MDYMRNLAYGLRQAAGVLNPDIQKQTLDEDASIEKTRQQFAQQQQLLRQRFEMEKQTPEYRMKMEQLENNQKLSRAIKDSGGDQAKLVVAFMEYGKPEVAMNIYNAQEQRAQRAQQAAQAHEARMTEIERRREEGLMRIQDSRQRAEFEQSFKMQMLSMKQQQDAANNALRKETLELKRLQLLTSSKETGAGMSAESAGKVAMADQAIVDIRGARSLIFDKDGKLNMETVAALNVPGTAGLPFNENARKAYSALYNAMESRLRIETGAAATEREIKSILKRFLPTISDPASVAKDKLDRLESFMNTTINQTKGVKPDLLRSRAQPSQPASNVPAPGTVVDGYRFKGGDPSKRENWEKP